MKTLLKAIRENNILLELVDGKLSIFAEESFLSPELIAEIEENKLALTQLLLDNTQNGVNDSFDPGIPVAPPSHDYPLSSTQRRLWILSQFKDASIAYNIPGVYTFEGDLDQSALEYAFNSLIQRHEILRTIFKEDAEGEIRQFVNSPEKSGFRIDYYDLIAEKDQEEKAALLIRQEIARPFDLVKGPLLRAALCRLSENRWIFIYVMHHIISDGWSMGVLITELLSFYNGYTEGDTTMLPPLRIQYKDYAVWQKGRMEDDPLKEHKDYWLKKMEGELPVLELLSGPRPPVRTYNGDTLYKQFDPSITRAIRSLGHGQGGTLFMALTAAVSALLYRYTGQNDIIIGIPIAGRDHIDLEDQIGFYVNTLALRMQFKGEDSYQQLLEKVKQVTLEAYQHQAYPFDELVDELHLHRDISRNPLFDVQVIVRDGGITNEIDHVDLGALTITKYAGAGGATSIFDMVFNFAETNDELSLNLTYNSDIYNVDMVARLSQHLEGFLQAIIASPRLPVSRLSFLDEVEKARLLQEFNDTAVAYPGPRTLVELFEEQVAKSPDKVAVVFSGEELSYRELNEQSDRLAGYLRAYHGVEAEELVGIMLDRSDKMIIAILGVLKAGGAYVPIDPDYPAARKDYILRDGGIRVLITHTEYIFNLDYYQGAVFAMDVQMDDLDSPAPMVRGTGAEALAYVIYTSGSTGQPKGVMIANGAIVNTIRYQREVFEAKAGERHLQFASCSFDASVSEIFVALSAGSALYIIGEEAKKEPRLLEEYLRENKIEMATIPPAYLKLLSIERLESLKKLITAGEAALRDKAMAFLRQGTYYNAYGPTETSICASVFKVEKGGELEVISVPIGVPVANTRVYILDGQASLQPIGVTGELWISGAGLARGYLNQPDLTGERFVANPFTKGERMYKTGDLGRWLPGGDIEFGGRKDDQVKIRGYRIELGEIEEVLQSYPGIDAAAVIVGRDSGEEKELIAYIAGNETVNLTDLRGHLNKTLPDYMLPGRYIQMESLPLTVNGKIDKKKITDAGGWTLSTATEYMAPGNEKEQKIAKIWEEVLEKEKIGMNDDYFELGGNSLKAMIIIKKMIDDMGVTLPMKILFSEKTIGNIVRMLDHIGNGSDSDSTKDLPFTNVKGPANLLTDASYNQVNYFSKWKIGNDVVVVSYRYRNLDAGAFSEAVYELIRRHEILRTVFVNIDGAIMQKVLPMEPGMKVAVNPIPVTGAELNRIMVRENNRVIDLYAFPLFFVKVFALEKEEYCILISLHHSITDGYSSGILQQELKQLYSEFHGKIPSALKPLPFQYKDFSKWQREFVESPEGIRHRDYWEKRLKGFNREIKMPSLMDGKRDIPAASFKTTWIIEGSFYEEIDRFIKKNSLTRPVVLMTALTLFENRRNGSRDVTFSATVSGRNSRYYGEMDVTGLIGFFANALFIRNIIDVDKTILDYLHQVRDNFIDDLNYDAYPFVKLLSHLPDITPDILGSTGFFNYHNYDYYKASEYKIDAKDREGYLEKLEPMKRAFGLTVSEYGDFLKLGLQWNPHLFQDESDKIKELFFGILKQVVQDAHLTIKQINGKIGSLV